MPLSAALEALKNRDFRTALTLVSRLPKASHDTPHFLIKGLAELNLQEWTAALTTFTKACQRHPAYDLFWLNRGIAEENLGLLDAAITSQTQCLSLNPKQAEASGNLSNLYRKQCRFAEAETMARQALTLGAAQADALNSLGLALVKQGKFSEARHAFTQAQTTSPDNPNILLNTANLEIEELNFAAAWPLFAAARALSDNPEIPHDEALARLLSGDLAQGFALFEHRLRKPNALRVHPACPRWHGENLTGKKLLIVAEQGYGDVIQFCRYQQFLPEGELFWSAPPTLIRLLSKLVRGTVLDETKPLPECDYHLPIMSLPWETRKNPLPLAGRVREGGAPPELQHRITNDLAPIPPPLPELIPPLPNPPRKEKGNIALPPGQHPIKIGLVWAGSPTHERDHERSIPLPLLAPLFQQVAANFYAPFLGPALNDIGAYPITRLDHLITDFADAASVFQQLDCLITVDTAAAHLAGTLNLPTYLLLPRCPDWRWGTTGEQTPWYPSLRLLRQPAYGDWPCVIEQLTKRLQKQTR